MALRPEQIADLDNLTLDYFEKGNYTDVSLNKQRYILEDALGGKGGRMAPCRHLAPYTACRS